MSILSLQRGSTEQQKKLHQIFDKDNVSDSDVQTIIDLYGRLGIIESARQEIQKHYDSAFELIDSFDDNPYKQDLIRFLTNLKNREY